MSFDSRAGPSSGAAWQDQRAVPNVKNSPGPNRTETAYSILKGRLFDGTYVPGYRIVINQLVRETGISAIPWREAIRQLEAEGWLETTRHVGPSVATFDAGVYEKSVQVLARLEGYVTAVASRRLAAEDLVAMRKINRKMEAALADFDPISLSSLNREFHFILYDNCGDEHLGRLISNEWNRVDLIRRGALRSIPERARDVVREHEALLDLVEAEAPPDEIEAVAAGPPPQHPQGPVGPLPRLTLSTPPLSPVAKAASSALPQSHLKDPIFKSHMFLYILRNDRGATSP